MDKQDISLILQHLGEDREQYHGAIAPPIFQNSNFSFPTVARMREALQREMDTPFYSRGYNPTVAILREKLAALEKTEDALVLSSGSGAIATAVISQLSAGDHVVCVQKPYSWSHALITKLLARFGVTHSLVDARDYREVEEALKPETRLIFLESPNSLTFEMQDLGAIAVLARSRGIVTVCDNSYNAALHSQPAELGIDLVCHSASKYLGGHGDIVAGVICGSRERIRNIMANEFMTLGAVISPHDAWLMIRGLRTLELRLERSADTADKLMDFLHAHPKAGRIYHPFHSENPQLRLAERQMKRASGLFSFELKTDEVKAAERFADALQHFVLACSWGGFESIAFPMAVFADSASLSTELPFRLVRLYAGLETPELLIEDLDRAFQQL